LAIATNYSCGVILQLPDPSKTRLFGKVGFVAALVGFSTGFARSSLVALPHGESFHHVEVSSSLSG
jgi:hypothetical protein